MRGLSPMVSTKISSIGHLFYFLTATSFIRLFAMSFYRSNGVTIPKITQVAEGAGYIAVLVLSCVTAVYVIAGGAQMRAENRDGRAIGLLYLLGSLYILTLVFPLFCVSINLAGDTRLSLSFHALWLALPVISFVMLLVGIVFSRSTKS